MEKLIGEVGEVKTSPLFLPTNYFKFKMQKFVFYLKKAGNE